MPGEGFIAPQKKLARHLFRSLVGWWARWPENPIAIGTAEQARLFAPNELTHTVLTRSVRAKIQAVANLVMPEASRPLAISIFVELYFNGAAFVSAVASAPRVRSVFSVLPFR